MRITIAHTLAAVFLIMMSTSALAKTNLLFNIFVPHNYFMWPVFQNWKQEVEGVTDGRVTVTFPAKSVAPPADQWSAVRNGLVDGAFIYNGLAPKSIKPLQEFGQLPFLGGPDVETASVAYWRTYEKFFADHEKTPKVKIISCFLFSGAQSYSLTDTPINSVAELRDRKMWALPGTAATILKSLNVSFTSGPSARMQELASRHVVEGAFGTSPYAVVHFQSAPYIKSATLFPSGINFPSFTAFVNKRKWMQISQSDRQAISRVSGEALARAVGKASDAGHEESLAAMKKNGTQLLKADPKFQKKLEQAGMPITQDWISNAKKLGVDGQAALNYYKTQVKKSQAK